MGKPGASRAEVEEAARKAQCYDFIMKMPYGFDTVLSEGGASLSGGERQRISIARCILKDAPVIILDEATANIDTETEVLIQDSLERMMNIGTMLMVAHRLSTIQHADNIIVLSHGRIVEQGNHQELLKQKGNYYRLYTLQYHKEKLTKK